MSTCRNHNNERSGSTLENILLRHRSKAKENAINNSNRGIRKSAKQRRKSYFCFKQLSWKICGCGRWRWRIVTKMLFSRKLFPSDKEKFFFPRDVRVAMRWRRQKKEKFFGWCLVRLSIRSKRQADTRISYNIELSINIWQQQKRGKQNIKPSILRNNSVCNMS